MCMCAVRKLDMFSVSARNTQPEDYVLMDVAFHKAKREAAPRGLLLPADGPGIHKVSACIL